MRCCRQACCARVDIDAGVLNEASGRWLVEVDADEAIGTAVPCQLSVRPVNLVAVYSRMRSRNVHEKQMMELERGPEINGPTGVICGRLLQASMLCSC